MSSWTPSPSYWVGSVPQERHRLSTSPTELAHLAIAFLVLTFDLAIVTHYLQFGRTPGGFDASIIVAGLAFAAAAALSGFVAHEMAHKVAAQRFGFWAEFRMSPVGLFISLVTAYAGFLFAAPGATVVHGMGDIREWGRTSLAGPALNLVEGAVFLGAAVAVWDLTQNFSTWVLLILLAFVNGWFAAFNLLPFGPLDGTKVLRWNRGLWAGVFAVAAVFTVAMFLILGSPRPPL